MNPFIPVGKMFRKNVSRHYIGHAIMKIDIWSRDPLVEPGDRDAVCTADVAQGGRTASTHDTGRGLVVLVDLQDYKAIEDAFPHRECGQARRPDRVVRTYNFGLNGRMTYRRLLFAL